MQPEQRGVLALTGLPDERYHFRVRRVILLAETLERKNVFRVEAEPEAAATSLRLGMRGIAKFEAAKHRLVWIWSHEIVD